MGIGYPLLLPLIASTVGVLAMSGCKTATSPAKSVLFTSAVVSEGPPIPIATAGHAGGLVDGMPVVVGGSHWSDDRATKSWLQECFVYQKDHWVPGPSLPHGMSDGAYAFNARGLYIVGGKDDKTPSNEVLQLAPHNGALKWESLTTFPETIESASAAIIADTLYVTGGFSGEKASNKLWSLDLKDPNAAWKSLAPLPASPRGYSAFVAAGSQLYLFGGLVLPPYQKEVALFGDAYRYDPFTNSWKQLDGFNLPGYAWTATAVNDQQIMFTGRVAKLSETSGEVLLLDLNTLQVKNVGELVTPSCCMPAIPMGGETWWLPGGEPAANRVRSARTSVVQLKR